MRLLIAFLLILLMVVSCVMVVRYAQNVVQIQQKLNEERFVRIKTEESLSHANKRISFLKNELTKANADIKRLDNSLAQVELDNSKLKTKLTKANNTIKQLEAKIKELVDISTAAAKAAKEDNGSSEKPVGAAMQ